MKKIGLTFFSIAAIGLFLTFQNCKDTNELTDKEAAEKLLQSKTWAYSSVNTPESTATIGTDWENFTVQFNATSMVTNGYPTGASAVWPSTTYSVSEDGKTISRGDGVDMLITNLSETNLVVVFTLTGGHDIGGRIASLDGEYTFNLK